MNFLTREKFPLFFPVVTLSIFLFWIAAAKSGNLPIDIEFLSFVILQSVFIGCPLIWWWSRKCVKLKKSSKPVVVVGLFIQILAILVSIFSRSDPVFFVVGAVVANIIFYGVYRWQKR